jgi:integrase
MEDDFKTKGRDNRFVPLRQETREALLQWRERTKHKDEEDYIFTGKKGGAIYNFDLTMGRILRSIGVEGHCQKFRDTFASYSLGCGVPPQNVRDYLGHESFEITNFYANYLPRKIEADIRQLFEWR